MNRWWWPLIGRAFVWAIMGGVCSALVGALCGACCSLAYYDSFFGMNVSGVAVFAGYLGAMAAGVPGLLVFFVLNFFCSMQRGFFQMPLRFIALGMVLGVAATVSCLLAALLGMYLTGRIGWTGVWPPDLLYMAVCGPAGLLLGQLSGALYTVFVAERRQHRTELTRWKTIIESDYDLTSAPAAE